MSRRVSSIPSGDAAFRDAAIAALNELGGHVPMDRVASLLADLLRPTYPDVEIHRQDAFARIFDEDVWYAYRDGKPSPA
jgi:hypothetical protein